VTWLGVQKQCFNNHFRANTRRVAKGDSDSILDFVPSGGLGLHSVNLSEWRCAHNTAMTAKNGGNNQ
jgi:hypothetical protein